MDIYTGRPNLIAADYKPKWTCWKPGTVTKDVIAFKRHARRTYKHYLKTGDIRDYNKSQYLVTRKDFD